jgi:predicted transcriptional regulator
MPDGAAFLTVARTLEGPQGAFGERPRRTAILIGCDIGFKDEVVYGAALPASEKAVAIGPACRLCERAGCLARIEPPVTRPLGLDEMATGLSAFEPIQEAASSACFANRFPDGRTGLRAAVPLRDGPTG